MQISSRRSSILLQCASFNQAARLRIRKDFGSVISTWTAGTRVSPIWPVRGLNSHDDRNFDFDGDNTVTFIGPTNAAKLEADIQELSTKADGISMWVGLGCFNAIVNINHSACDSQIAETLAAWARACEVPHEQWLVRNGDLVSRSQFARNIDSAVDLAALKGFAESNGPAQIRATVQEYCALMASSLTRSASISSYLYTGLVSVNKQMTEMLAQFKSGKMNLLDFHSRLLSMNAAISRFSSQAFSGIPPIESTECHYWIHSCLGTGAANIALARLTEFVRASLGEARLPERIAKLREETNRPPSLEQLTNDPDLVRGDHLSKVALDEKHLEQTAPLVTYFSGRDGFSSHVQTLSAPLTTISEANSFRSNLLTITHELSHVFVQGVLAEIYPDADVLDELTHATEMLQPRYQAKNWLDAARQLLMEGLVSMEQESHGGDPFPPGRRFTNEIVAEVLSHQRREAQEIMVHTFDFLYFYRGDANFYIEGIWQSWCAIPGIKDRVPEYVMRTLCAISPDLLLQPYPKRAPAAIGGFSAALETLLARGELPNDYAKRALVYLNKNATSLTEPYRARMYLVRLVTTFLFSETIAAKLFSEPHIRGTTPTGYAKTRGTLDLSPIGNPLRFLREHLKADPSEAESLWVLHNLAFNTSSGGGE